MPFVTISLQKRAPTPMSFTDFRNSKTMSELNSEQQRLSKNTDLTYWNERWLTNKMGSNRLNVNK
jgi:hypothetical protein